ncbi:DUF5946 family protein, partial [Nesterenkonia alkaliphila]|uniref:DUF5946 family protein n=1 Tax=Nesterenkonia alkaliphila TaxID=1463631 RepID=UPI0035A24817
MTSGGAAERAIPHSTTQPLNYLRDTPLAPWGPHHGANVACYYLQHPSTAPKNTADGQWAMIQAYNTGGLEAASQLQSRRIAENRNGLFEPDEAMGQVPCSGVTGSPSCWVIMRLRVREGRGGGLRVRWRLGSGRGP